MTRIDPIMMLDAYWWTQVYPTSTAEFCYPDVYACMRCCPIAAVALYAKRVKEHDLRKHADLAGGISGVPAFIRVICDSHGQASEALGIMRRLLDVTRPYMRGYIMGYDRYPLDPLYIEPFHADFDLGYADGGLARAVLEAMDFKVPCS